MHFCQLCCKIFTKNLEKFRLKTEEDCEKKSVFQRKCSSWRRCYGQVIAVLQNRYQKIRVKSPNMVCSNFKTETNTFLLERHTLIQNISLETKTSSLTKLSKNATECPERSTLKSGNCWKRIHFFKTTFPSLCSAGGKSALWTRLPHIFRHKTEKISLKSGNGWWIEKKSNTSCFSSKRSSGN